MSTASKPGFRGQFLERTAVEVESLLFVKEQVLTLLDAGEGAADPKLRGHRRRTYAAKLYGNHVEFELLLDAASKVVVAALWFSRQWLQDRANVPSALTLIGRFLRDALGEVSPADTESVGNLLAVSFEIQRNFEPLLQELPFVPRDGVGAATEVFLGRRLEASAQVFGRMGSVIYRNDETGRLFVGLATQKAVFELGTMLFHAPLSFARGDRAGIAGWKTPEIEATPFGRRFHVEHDRSAPPQGRIARRYFGFQRIARAARVEMLMEPTRGMAGVLLRIDQDWIETSDTNYFVALELIAAFVAEGIGDTPDARTRVEIGDLFSCAASDGDIFAALVKELPFIQKGKTGGATAVFLGESERAVGYLDEGRVAVVAYENPDGWFDVMFHLTEFAEAIGEPAAEAPAP